MGGKENVLTFRAIARLKLVAIFVVWLVKKQSIKQIARVATRNAGPKLKIFGGER